MNTIDNRYSSNSGIEFHHTITPINEVKNNYANISHSHPQFEIYYLVKGDVYYHVGGQKYKVDEGSLLFLNMFSPHQVEVLPTSDCDRYVLEFTMNYIPTINGLSPAYYFFEKRHLLKILSPEVVAKTQIFDLFKKIEAEALNKNEFTGHIILGYILQIMSIASIAEKEQTQSLIPTISNEYKKFAQYINETTQYINANVDKKISIDDIANNVHISRSYLQHIFKKCVGISLSDYIFNQKMHCAKFMIADGKTFQEIAGALGYKYYSTFSADYKKMFGVSPKVDALSKK